MGLFDVFKKKACCICGNEVGLIGNRKLADGNMCSKCTKDLSPWFTDRKESTVQQIKAQLEYRAWNAEELKTFETTRTIGDYEKICIEEVDGIPIRFFVLQYGEGMGDNPDIISFRDVVSCVLDLDIRDEEQMQHGEGGKMVSYNPPRFRHYYNFIIRMEIRNNPYFDKIHFTVNSGAVTLETVGAGGRISIDGAVLSGILRGVDAGLGHMRNMRGIHLESHANARERRRFSEYQMMCDEIIQVVEIGKCGMPLTEEEAVDPEAVMTELVQKWEEVEAMQDDMAADHVQEEPVQEEPVQEKPRPNFCSNCGAPCNGGKFCSNCGSKL